MLNTTFVDFISIIAFFFKRNNLSAIVSVL